MDKILIRITNSPMSSYYAVVFFLLVSVFFSLLYYIFLPLLEGSSVLGYKDSSLGTEITSFVDCLYFSVTTQTTVGYGDIVPTSFLGKTCSIVQCAFGYLYLGFLISLFTAKAILKSKRFQIYCQDH